MVESLDTVLHRLLRRKMLGDHVYQQHFRLILGKSNELLPEPIQITPVAPGTNNRDAGTLPEIEVAYFSDRDIKLIACAVFEPFHAVTLLFE